LILIPSCAALIQPGILVRHDRKINVDIPLAFDPPLWVAVAKPAQRCVASTAPRAVARLVAADAEAPHGAIETRPVADQP
jgi:hypothetical protein